MTCDPQRAVHFLLQGSEGDVDLLPEHGHLKSNLDSLTSHLLWLLPPFIIATSASAVLIINLLRRHLWKVTLSPKVVRAMMTMMTVATSTPMLSIMACLSKTSSVSLSWQSLTITYLFFAFLRSFSISLWPLLLLLSKSVSSSSSWTATVNHNWLCYHFMAILPPSLLPPRLPLELQKT